MVLITYIKIEQPGRKEPLEIKLGKINHAG